MKQLWRKVVDFFSRKKSIKKQIQEDEKKVAEVCDSSTDDRIVFDREPLYGKEPKKERKTRTRSKSWNRDNYTLWQTQEVTLKEAFFMNYLKEKSHRWVTPTEVGRSYGYIIKSRNDYNAGHARHCLLRLVKFNLIEKNENGHYKIL